MERHAKGHYAGGRWRNVHLSMSDIFAVDRTDEPGVADREGHSTNYRWSPSSAGRCCREARGRRPRPCVGR